GGFAAESNNKLTKIKLGNYLFDALYNSKLKNTSWVTDEPLNHIQSPSDLFLKGNAEFNNMVLGV
ncbi:hypothetical protein KAR34_04755, partial [bacterium]|nr:hypothetical protein [bacterium]